MMTQIELRQDDVLSVSYQEIEVRAVTVEDGSTENRLQRVRRPQQQQQQQHLQVRERLHSTGTNARDTSGTCRDGSLDNTRQTANTYASILDLTKDDDDDDDDEEESDCGCYRDDVRGLEASLMFADLHTDRHSLSLCDADVDADADADVSADVDRSFFTARQDLTANDSALPVGAPSSSQPLSSPVVSPQRHRTVPNGLPPKQPPSTASPASPSPQPSPSHRLSVSVHSAPPNDVYVCDKSPSRSSSPVSTASTASTNTASYAVQNHNHDHAHTMPRSRSSHSADASTSNASAASMPAPASKPMVEPDRQPTSDMLSQWDSVTDTFLDSLCATSEPPSSSCAPCPSSGKVSFSTPCPVPSSATVSGSATIRTSPSSSTTDLASRHEASRKIMQLLGCNVDPTGDELDQVWMGSQVVRQSAASDKPRPKRLSHADRLLKLQRLQQLYNNNNNINNSFADTSHRQAARRPVQSHRHSHTQGRVRNSVDGQNASFSHHRRTRYGLNLLPPTSAQQSPTLHKPRAFVRSQTLDERKLRNVSAKTTPSIALLDPLSMWIGGPGLDPILPAADGHNGDESTDGDNAVDGYDSDPELPRLRKRSPMTGRLHPMVNASLMDEEDCVVANDSDDDESLSGDGDFESYFEQPFVQAGLSHDKQRRHHGGRISFDRTTRSPRSDSDSVIRQHRKQSKQQPRYRPVMSTMAAHDMSVQHVVQETLNTTWTLTWHPNSDNMKEFGISSKPICINIWMERGTVLPNTGVVLEPQLMWRDAYQPKLISHKTLTATATKPWSIRLLNTCRIVAMDDTTRQHGSVTASAPKLCRSTYPLARQNCSLMLKTCQKQEFLLEAQTPAEKATIAEHWKIVVARFASLAVTEDVDTISEEFFHNLNGVPNVGLSPI